MIPSRTLYGHTLYNTLLQQLVGNYRSKNVLIIEATFFWKVFKLYARIIQIKVIRLILKNMDRIAIGT